MKSPEQWFSELTDAKASSCAFIDVDEIADIQNDVLDAICKKLNQNTCDGWPDCGSPMCDYNQQLIRELTELKKRDAAMPNDPKLSHGGKEQP
jgi:hypothetical protein